MFLIIDNFQRIYKPHERAVEAHLFRTADRGLREGGGRPGLREGGGSDMMQFKVHKLKIDVLSFIDNIFINQGAHTLISMFSLCMYHNFQIFNKYLINFTLCNFPVN